MWSAPEYSLMDVFRKIVLALHVRSDSLLFDEEERGPDDDLRLHFEAASKFDSEKKRMLRICLTDCV